MTKMAITIEGSIEEILPVLVELSKMNAPKTVSHVSPLWTGYQVNTVWKGITREAQRIFREVAEGPDVYPFDQLKHILGLSGNQIGGRLSSVGHQLRIKGCQNFPRPLLTDVPTQDGSRGFKLDPVWRDTILEMDKQGI